MSVQTAARVRVAHRRKARRRPLIRWRVRAEVLERVLPPGVGLALAAFAFLQAAASLLTTQLEAYSMAWAGGLALGAAILALHSYRLRRVPDPIAVMLLGLSLVLISVIGGLPLYFGVLSPNGIAHRSLISAIGLLALSVPLASTAIYYLWGATPRAADLARYPVILLPVVILLALIGVILGDLLIQALGELRDPARIGLKVLVQPYSNPAMPPAYRGKPGLLDQFLGTGLLMACTTLLALPIGVGTGVFISEYGTGLVGSVVRASTSALRGISTLLIALAGAAIVTATMGSPLARYVGGFFVDAGGTLRTGSGSYLLASALMAILVIPIVARATDEGCRSVPHGIREGAAALGASDDYTLLRIVLPWALPNIVTSVLLGCAEAAGSVTVLLFIGGAGGAGVGPFSEVTSVALAVFLGQFSSSKPFRDQMGPFEYVAGVELLVISLGLTILALVLKSRYANRYRGA